MIKEDELEKLNDEYTKLPQKHKIRKQQKPVIRQKKKKSPSRINMNFTENLEKIKKIIDILRPSRADNYDEWQNLGWCLHNIDDRLLQYGSSLAKIRQIQRRRM